MFTHVIDQILQKGLMSQSQSSTPYISAVLQEKRLSLQSEHTQISNGDQGLEEKVNNVLTTLSLQPPTRIIRSVFHA